MKTKNKQIWIFIQVTVFGIVVAGLGLLVFSLKANNIARQESNPNNDIPQPLQGTITQVEQGKDGVQAELKTEYGLYSRDH
jgi:flagellar basal body-associated protein FliL